MSYVRLWRFQAAAGKAREFEAAYGPDGDWARLFRHAPGYLGTELLRDTSAGDSYLTLDRWRREADWHHFQAAHAQAYAALDRQLAPLCAGEQEIGSFAAP